MKKIEKILETLIEKYLSGDIEEKAHDLNVKSEQNADCAGSGSG